MQLVYYAILPILIFLLVIYLQDKYKKEPFSMLAKSFGGGVLSLVCVVLVLWPFSVSPFDDLMTNSFYDAFLMAAIPEESFKFLFLWLIVWKSRYFDEYFDGIFYAVFVSLGFACVENLMYVLENGMGTAIVRALLSVPGHFLFAVAMGFFFSLAKFVPAKRMLYLFYSLASAILLHGLFDFLLCLMNGLTDINVAVCLLLWLVFIGFDVAMWIFGIKLIKRLMAKDAISSHDEGA